MYGSQFWALNGWDEIKMKVAKARRLSGVTRLNGFRNEYIRGCLGVVSIATKMRENILRYMDMLKERKIIK